MHTAERILVTTDGSAAAGLALPVAADLARTAGSAVNLVYVVTDFTRNFSTEVTFGLDVERLRAEQHAEGEQTLARAARHFSMLDLTCNVVDATGNDVAGAINAEARRWDASMIVMATHGRGGLARFLLGSVAERVLQHASVPVLLVRQPHA